MLRGFLSENWFELVQTLSILLSLIFAGITIREHTKTRRIGNLLTLTASHRELWTACLRNPLLHNVLSSKRSLKKAPPSEIETQFVTLIILHLRSTFEAMRDGMAIHEAGVSRDIKEFFELPLPRHIWTLVRNVHEPEFVEFVERTHTPKAFKQFDHE